MPSPVLKPAAPSPYIIESYAGDVPANQVTYSIATPDGDEGSRAQGDRQLARSIGPAPFSYPLFGPDSLFNIPAHSTLGLWMNQLDSALRTPDLRQWMKTQGIASSNVQFDPDKNALSAVVNGQSRQFTLDDDSGFSAVAGPLIQAVRTLGFWPRPSGHFLLFPFKPYNVAHFQDVLRFYGVDPLNPPSGNPTFAPIASTEARRGDAALAEQQQVVGDVHDRCTLLDRLTRLLAKLPAAPLSLAADLAGLKMNIHPGSTFHQAHPRTATASVAHFMRESGAPLPKTLEALKKLIRTLRNDPLEQARTAREKKRYSQLLHTTAQALPDVRKEAKRWAEDIIFNLTGARVDADKIFLNRFHGASSAPTITGWEHTDQEPWRSQALPDALLGNFSESDGVPGNLDLYSGLYTVGAGQIGNGGYGAHNQFPLAPSALMHESWKTDFQQHITHALRTFWHDHAEDYRAILKGSFVLQARQQLKAYEHATPDARARLAAEQSFTRDDYNLVLKAASNVPLDENEPLTVEQLRMKTPVKGVVRTHVLDINGRRSNDILRFSAADNTTQILYIPGHLPAFLRFTSLETLDQWVADQGKSTETRAALASHFPLRDRQDDDLGFWSDVKSFITGDRQSNKGVDTALKYLGNDNWDHLEGVVIDKDNVVVHGDIFSTIKDATLQRMTRDADTRIKSNGEVTRDTWLNDLSAAAGLMTKLAVVGEPLVIGAAAAVGVAQTGVGISKAITGDTQAERAQGASSALDGALNTLFSLGGGAVEEDIFEATPPIAVRHEVFSDGRKALVIDRSIPETAYTLPRSDGYDLVDGTTVYRYRSTRPDALVDMAAADPHEPLEGFGSFCAAPGLGRRVKRGANDECLSKVIVDVPATAASMQALEHVRLFPSKPGLFNKQPTLVYEKRLHTRVETDTGAQWVPVPGTQRITYKKQIHGKIIDDPGFGFYSADATGTLQNNTRVVKLDQISNISHDKRQVRGVVVPSNGHQYLVVEADTAEFYYAPLTKANSAEMTFKKCGPFDLSLVQGYRQFLSVNHPVQTLDAEFIALPKLKEAYRQLEKAGFTQDALDELKRLCIGLRDEQQREVVYQLQRANAIRPANIALRPQRVVPLEKPPGFASWPRERQNRFYAQNSKDSVDQALRATGLGPGNQVRSPADLARADAAHITLEWLRRTTNLRAPHATDHIMKTGAGNCGEMALLARDIVNQSGGVAREWSAADAHAFTVIGGQPGAAPTTIDFSEPVWADAWVVDPWAGIACPAAEYTQHLKRTMIRWDQAGLKIRAGSKADMSPTDPDWLDQLIDQPKSTDAESTAQQPRRLIPEPPAKTAPITHVAMGESVTLHHDDQSLSTQSLTDCSALAVLTDWDGTQYQTRTLMHLTGSNLALGLDVGNPQALLDRLQASLQKGGQVILVGGVNTQSIQGLAIVIGQELGGRQPLRELLKERPGVSVTLASSLGVTIKADGTLTLREGTGKGVLPPDVVRQIFDRVD